MGLLEFLKSFNTSSILYQREIPKHVTIIEKIIKPEKINPPSELFFKTLKEFEEVSRNAKNKMLYFGIKTPNKKYHEGIGMAQKEGKGAYFNMNTSKFYWFLNKTFTLPSIFGYFKNLGNEKYTQYVSAHFNMDKKSSITFEYEEIDLEKSLIWEGESFDEVVNLDKINYVLQHKNDITYKEGKLLVRVHEPLKNYADILNLDDLPDEVVEVVLRKLQLGLQLKKCIDSHENMVEFLEKINEVPNGCSLVKLVYDIKNHRMVAWYAHNNHLDKYDASKTLDAFKLGEVVDDF